MSAESIDWDNTPNYDIPSSLEDQRREALAKAGEALGVVSGMMVAEEQQKAHGKLVGYSGPDVIEVPAVVQQAMELNADNDRRLRDLAARYRVGIDNATLIGMRVAALCDFLIGESGSEVRAVFELELQQNYAKLITEVESQARYNALTQGIMGQGQNGGGR